MSDITYADYRAKIQAENRKTVTEALDAVIPVLQEQGVTVVAIRFDGYGDSGSIDHTWLSWKPCDEDEFEDLEGDDVEPGDNGLLEALFETTTGTRPNPHYHGASFTQQPETLPVTVDDRLLDIAHAVLESSHGGWEINEGAFGYVLIHVASRQIAVDYNQRVESSEYSRTTF